VPSRPKHDSDLPFREEPEGTHDVVAALDLVVDVLDTGVVGREQCNRVMHFVDAQERRVADTIAHARIADPSPERLVAHGVRGAQANMTEAGDAGITHAMIARAAVGGSPHQLNPIARRVIKTDELAYLPGLRLVGRAGVNRVSESLQLTCS